MYQAPDKIVRADIKTPLEKTVDDLLFIVLEGLQEEHGKELTYAEVMIRTVKIDGMTASARSAAEL